MKLTEGQERGLKIAVERYKNKEPYTVISGFGGTGKTTLIRHIISALGLYEDEVCYAAYTGKASMVLKENGCKNAVTAHKLLYHAHQKKDGSYFFTFKNKLDAPYKLIVIDEVSMLPKDMWEQLLKHKVHVIALGDPGQLPPITSDNNILQNPHVLLTEIVRQALDNEIIRISMDIREGKKLRPYQGEQVRIYKASDFDEEMLKWGDACICAKNATRAKLNRSARKLLLGVETPEPINGDKLICLQNYWNLENSDGDIIINGTVGTVSDLKLTNNFKPPLIPNKLSGTFLPDGIETPFRISNFDYKLLTTGEPAINKDNFKMVNSVFHPYLFDYAYAITAWKSQGSQYNKVLLIEETFPWKEDDHRKYMYTGITRAIDKAVIILKD